MLDLNRREARGAGEPDPRHHRHFQRDLVSQPRGFTIPPGPFRGPVLSPARLLVIGDVEAENPFRDAPGSADTGERSYGSSVG